MNKGLKVRRGAGSFNKSIVIVSAPTGSDVTLSKDGVIKRAVEKNGEWLFRNVDTGVWTVTANSKTVSGKGESVVSLNNTPAGEAISVKLYGKTTQDGTPTPEKPIPLVNAGDSGSISPKVCGKNLLHYPYDHTTKTEKGVTFTDNGDGSITIQGTASGDAWFHLMKYDIGKLWWSSKYKLEPYIFSGVPESTRLEYNPTQKLTIITVPSGVSIDATVYPQVEIGTVATAWEPPQKAQIVNVQTPNGLPGIPVGSGGNYIDSTGQQWICDEIDFARGVYVRRIGYISTASMNFYIAENDGYPVGESLFFRSIVSKEGAIPCKDGLCSKLPFKTAALNTDIDGFYFLGAEVYCRIQGVSDLEEFKSLISGAEFLYVLPSTVETALSDEELESYAALTSYNGKTNVIAQDCGIEASVTAYAVQTATKTVNVTQFDVYRLTMSYFKATIKITYPGGSTCTCFKDDKTYTAPDTSGSWDCVVDSAGDWTVQITADGKEPETEVVSITENGQEKAVAIDYNLWIIKGGVERKTVNLHGKSEKSSGIGYMKYGGTDYGYHSAEASGIDLTGYKTIICECYGDAAGQEDVPQIAVWNNSQSNPTTENTLAYVNTTSSKETIRLDVSKFNGLHKVGFAFKYITSVSVYNMYVSLR